MKIALLSIAIISNILSIHSCPSTCFCRQIRKHFHVNCHSPLFLEIKKSIPIDVQRIVIMIPKVERFDEFSLNGYKALRHLYIEAESLSEIHHFTFLNLTHLREIRILRSKIKILKANMFNGLLYLYNIEICENKELVTIEENAFAGLPSLVHLRLANNALVSLPNGLFEGLHTLEYIFLEHNNLQTLNFTIFASLPNLTSITADNNKINNITGNLGTLTELYIIYLQNNFLREIKSKTFANLIGLTELNLDGNMITSIHHDAFCNSNFIQTLRLSQNRLMSIDPRLFHNLTNLKIIHLNNNNLQNFHRDTFAHQSSLKELFLDKNELKIIDKVLFKSLQNISRLDLQDNKLTWIPFIESTKMKHLISLDLSRNQIPCTCFYLYTRTMMNVVNLQTDCVLKGVAYEITNQTCKFITEKLKMSGGVIRNNAIDPSLPKTFENQFMIILKFRLKDFSNKYNILQITNWTCLNKNNRSISLNETQASKTLKTQMEHAEKTTIRPKRSSDEITINERYRFMRENDTDIADNNNTCDIISVTHNKRAIEIRIQRYDISSHFLSEDIENKNWNTIEIRQTFVQKGFSKLEVFNNGKLLSSDNVKERKIISEAGLILKNNSYAEVEQLTIYSSKGEKVWMDSEQTHRTRVLLLTSVIFFVLLLAVVFLISLKTCCKRHQV